MIAKSIILLAIVAQISCSVCHQRTYITSDSDSSSRKILIAEASAPSATATIQTSNNSGFGSASGLGSASGSGAITKNIVAKGKYPVALSNCGPTPDRQIPVTFSYSTAPLQEKPTVRLPARIPEQRTIAHSCTCYKTLLRPRVHDHVVSVPSIERYIETGHIPVIENIHYEADPVNCKDETDQKYYFVKADGQSSSQSSSDKKLEIIASVPARQSSQSIEFVSAAPIEKSSPKIEIVSTPAQQCSQRVEIFAQKQAPQSIEFVSAPVRQATQTVEFVSAPARQATQTVEFVSAPARQATQTVELVSAPVRSQSVEIVSAPVRQSTQSVEILSAPVRSQSVEIVSAPVQQSAPKYELLVGAPVQQKTQVVKVHEERQDRHISPSVHLFESSQNYRF